MHVTMALSNAGKEWHFASGRRQQQQNASRPRWTAFVSFTETLFEGVYVVRENSGFATADLPNDAFI